MKNILFILFFTSFGLWATDWKNPFADLEGKVVIVTGGASGIGESIVRSYAAAGAQPVIFDRDRDKGRALADELDIQFIELDLTDDLNCQKAVDLTVKKLGRIDCVVNNAGVNDGVKLGSSPESFRRSLNLNLVHYYTVVNCALKQLRQNQGCIINVGSKVSVTGQGNTSGYAASKGGILALTREWAIALAKDGIRVNSVIPAEVDTPQYRRWINMQPNPEETMENIGNMIPLGRRFTTPQEIANVVLFLSSDLASHMTGQHLFVDGGYTHLDRAY